MARRSELVEIRILDDAGRQVPHGKTGRIFVGNTMSFDGYTGGGKKEVIAGHMSTGDVGHLDAGGRLHIDGRDDDMIVSGGENVFPQEVEELLAGHGLAGGVLFAGRTGQGQACRFLVHEAHQAAAVETFPGIVAAPVVERTDGVQTRFDHAIAQIERSFEGLVVGGRQALQRGKRLRFNGRVGGGAEQAGRQSGGGGQ